MHVCKPCEYYYETLSSDSSAPVYDALMNAVRSISVEFDRPCCGFSPGGIGLDPESPQCKDFEPKKIKE